MNSTMDVRNHIIDQLLLINDKEYLLALSKMIENAQVQTSAVSLTEAQRLMLTMSDNDIQEGKVIDQQTLHEQELKWLKGK